MSRGAITKQIDVTPWVAGTNAGGFPSLLTLTADTWYHLFIIKNPSSGVVDAGFDSNLSATNLLNDATGFTRFRRVGSVKVTAASILRRHGFDSLTNVTGGMDAWREAGLPCE